MPMSLPAATVRYLCDLGAGDVGLSDAELLGRFVDRRDGAAFAILVRRHADMVYGVCRRLLPTDQDAEDAFQAAFLVLAEKADTVAPRGAVGNWLYGVARRAALLARRSIARRRERMTELTDLPAPPPDPLAELRAALDAEVSRLTDVLRTVIVLCDLEGRTRKEAAAILGWPEGTVAGRLARARRLLAKRLARHAPAVSVAAALSATAARVPAAVLALTPPDGRVVPASVTALTRAVLANLAGWELMKTVIAVLVLGCTGLGMTLGAGQDKGNAPAPIAAGNAVAAAEKPVQADPVVFWGKEVGGLQAGLSLVATTTERVGDTARLTVKLEVQVRNVGKAPATITYGSPWERAPTITDAAGKDVPVRHSDFWIAPILLPRDRVIEPGKMFTLSRPEFALEVDAKQPAPKDVPERTVRVRPGAYTILYDWVADSHKKLATGSLPFKVMDPGDPKAAAADEVAWGMEVNGLQAGLSILSGGEYASETSTLVVRVRNVGKETVKFSYLQPLVEHSFTVTGSDGKPVPQPKILSEIGERIPGVVELAPGKEVVLHEFKRRFLPAGKGGSDYAWKKPDVLYHGTGKTGIRYDQVFGTPEMGAPGWELDPALGKLSTGTLELTVTDTGKVGERDDDNPAGIAERYFLAALAGRIDDAVKLAVKGTSPAGRERVEELAKQFRAIRRPSVYAAADEALVVSEVVKFAKPRPEGEGQVFLVFTVVKSGGVWLVRDIDATNLDGVIARVLKFKTAGPAAPPMPAEAPDAATGPRATVERYLAAALAGRVDEAVGLAVKGTSPRAPADRKQVAEFRMRVVASEVRLWKMLAAWDAGEAVAVTEEFRWVEFRSSEPENPNVAAPPRVDGQPEGTRVAYASAFLAFNVVKSGDWWLVKDADVTTEKDALDRVEAFRTKHPAATAVPARAGDTHPSAPAGVRGLQTERIKTLNEAAESSMALAKNGRGEVGDALEARVILLRAELEIVEQEADRVALYEKALESMKQLERLAVARKAAARGTELDVLRARAKRLEIEIALAKYK
jgi:RNA polymerase sigma factor (sigma-70 family)